jgi:hypothetical protein
VASGQHHGRVIFRERWMVENKKSIPDEKQELVERIFYEHISYLYFTIIICVLIFLAIVAAAIISEIWYIIFAAFILILPIYLKTRRRNRFMITNLRFIRVLANPKSGTIDVPLGEIVSAKSLGRSADAKATVHIYTTPTYGDQILVDNENEVGVISCHKMAGHADFVEVLTDAIKRFKRIT